MVDVRAELERIVEESRKGVRFTVYVKPEQDKVALRLEYGDLVFYTDEPPVGGRANASLIRYLSRVLGVNPGLIDIVHGSRSRSKVIEVEGITKEQAIEKLAAALGE